MHFWQEKSHYFFECSTYMYKVLYCVCCNCFTRKLDFADFELAYLKPAEVTLADYCHTRW